MNELRSIPLDSIELSQTESQKARRASFDKAGLEELAASVKADGIVVPIIVRLMRAKEEHWYELVAGERRFIAAEKAKLDTIPAVVRDLTDEQVVAFQLIENLQREGLHPMHEAESYHALVHQFKHPIEDVIAQVGKSRSYVYGRMKLLALSKKCRKAFYDGTIGASIAEKLARIPVEKTQDEALAEITRDDWSYRRAADTIREKFMLKLADASFPTDVELAGAGPCGTCPKRTGNAPDLFGDIKSADICTDTVCFAAKGRAHGQQLVEAARDRGQTVITGAHAKKVIPHGIRSDVGSTYLAGGFSSVEHSTWNGKKDVKIGKLVGPEAERTLVVDGETGRTIEVVSEAAVRKALGERGQRTTSTDSGDRTHRANVVKAQRETKFRVALFTACRQKLKAPTKRAIALLVARAIGSDDWEQVQRLEAEAEGKKYDSYKISSYQTPTERVKKLSDSDLDQFVAEAVLIDGLKASAYRLTEKPIALLAAAKSARVDVGKIRAELAPKKKLKAKK